MELNEFIAEVADKHVARSLSEMSDDAKVATWESGERAKEQAAEIVTKLLADAQQALEQRSKDNAV